MKRIGRIAGVVALAGAVFVGTSVGACGGGTENPPATNEPDLTGVIYAGAATDEALEALLLAAPKTDPAQAAAVDTPAAGATLPKDVPPTIEWHVSGSSAAREPSAGERIARAAKAIGSFFGPREAWAHGAPVNGRAYLLVFSTPKSPELVRVFTTELSYTFDAANWTKLALTGEPVTLVVTNAIFEDNRVAQDGGPFTGNAVTFSIGP